MPERVLHVLVVDDSKDQYIMVQDFLEFTSSKSVTYIVDWAESYDSAMDKVHNRRFDVCLVDYELGEASGLDFIKNVTEKQFQLPMILLTGHGSHKIDLEAMKAGAVDYLDKTEIMPNTLERSIRYALANQNLVERERHQRLVIESLLDTALALSATFEFDSVFERILNNMQNVIPHDSANLLFLEENYKYLIGGHGYNQKNANNLLDTLRKQVAEMATFQLMTKTRSPLLIENTNVSEHWIWMEGAEQVKSYLGVPIIIGDKVIGFLNFDSYEINKFSHEHVNNAQIFAEQSAQAIRNSRAYEQAQVLAATQERQRLARDLHDAVSQTLFSASVIAQTLPRFVDSDSDALLEGLDELNRLNRGALAEMRTLLVELRPQTLAETDLSTLLRNLIHAFNSRSLVNIESRIHHLTTKLPPDVHIAFYRIAQEALNNIQKYANATRVTVELIEANQNLQLRVADNGIGFNQHDIPPGHFGLKIMQERACDIQADLNITSETGVGTAIELSWTLTKVSKDDKR